MTDGTVPVEVSASGTHSVICLSECHTDDVGNGGKRRWPRSGYGWGWLVLSLGALVAGGTIVLFYIVFVSAECRRPDTSWGDNRAFFCRDLMGGFVASSIPWVVLAAVSVAIIAGLVGGTMTVLRRGRRMRGAWLTSTAIAYALLTAGAIWLPNSGSIDADVAFSVLPLTALIATGLLVVWVGITGGLGVLVLAARRFRPVSDAGGTRVPS
ncbi:hypothetical protein NS183_15365 [Microbacterium testaceum]|uniref:hypothetical protein n=1 Tax=Microbacterium testaceum TaxID=2033 RepID=UPI0007349340|nr:hypothetical protein [Microbacterium testaceum]KTS83739.1 hypothetical protein NS183_15365 [Microbacterium testaceum]